jgi:hypothetical protein
MMETLTIPKRNWTGWFWRIVFWVIIIYSIPKWLIPALGNDCSQSLNRLGLLFQIFGLVSLIPEVINLETEKHNKRREKILLTSFILLNYMETYQQSQQPWNSTIVENEQRERETSFHRISTLVIGVVTILYWLLNKEGVISVNHEFDKVIPWVALIYSIWLLFSLFRIIFAHMKWRVPERLIVTYNNLDAFLVIPIYLLFAFVLSIIGSIVGSFSTAFALPLPYFLKTRTLPLVVIGSILEFIATFPVSRCSL